MATADSTIMMAIPPAAYAIARMPIAISRELDAATLDELADRDRRQPAPAQLVDARARALGRHAQQQPAAGLRIARERGEELGLDVGRRLGGERNPRRPAHQ